MEPGGKFARSTPLQIKQTYHWKLPLLNGLPGLNLVFTIDSGPASIAGTTLSTNASGSGTVTLKASVSGGSYAPSSSTITFDVDGSKAGQIITFKHNEKGGLRDLPLSRRPTPLGKMVNINSPLPEVLAWLIIQTILRKS